MVAKFKLHFLPSTKKAHTIKCVMVKMTSTHIASFFMCKPTYDFEFIFKRNVILMSQGFAVLFISKVNGFNMKYYYDHSLFFVLYIVL